jgi:hypothetical protein
VVLVQFENGCACVSAVNNTRKLRVLLKLNQYLMDAGLDQTVALWQCLLPLQLQDRLKSRAHAVGPVRGG